MASNLAQIGWFSLADYGYAKPSGIVGDGTDDTLAWNAWVAALPADGACGWIPPAPSGAYNFAAGIAISGKTNCRIMGAGAPISTDIYGVGGAVLKFSQLTGDCLQVSVGSYDIQGFSVERAAGSTGGHSISFSQISGSTFRQIGTPNAVNAWGCEYNGSVTNSGNVWVEKCFGTIQTENGIAFNILGQCGTNFVNCTYSPTNVLTAFDSVLLQLPSNYNIDTVVIDGGSFYGFGHCVVDTPNPGIAHIDIFLRDFIFDGGSRQHFLLNAGSGAIQVECSNLYLGSQPGVHTTPGFQLTGNVTLNVHSRTQLLNCGQQGFLVVNQTGGGDITLENFEAYSCGRSASNTYDAFQFGQGTPTANVRLWNCKATGGYHRYGLNFDNTQSHTNIHILGGLWQGISGGLTPGSISKFITSSIDCAPGISEKIGNLTTPTLPASGASATNPYPCKVCVYVSGGAGVTVYRESVPVGGSGTLLRLVPGESYSLGSYTTAPTLYWFGE